MRTYIVYVYEKINRKFLNINRLNIVNVAPRVSPITLVHDKLQKTSILSLSELSVTPTLYTW